MSAHLEQAHEFRPGTAESHQLHTMTPDAGCITTACTDACTHLSAVCAHGHLGCRCLPWRKADQLLRTQDVKECTALEGAETFTKSAASGPVASDSWRPLLTCSLHHQKSSRDDCCSPAHQRLGHERPARVAWLRPRFLCHHPPRLHQLLRLRLNWGDDLKPCLCALHHALSDACGSKHRQGAVQRVGVRVGPCRVMDSAGK